MRKKVSPLFENAHRVLRSLTEREAMTTSWNCLLGMGPGEPDLGHEVWRRP